MRIKLPEVRGGALVRIAVALLMAAMLSGCFGRQKLAKTGPLGLWEQNAVALFAAAVNSRAPAAICARYAGPSARCRAIWRQRLAHVSTPIDVSHAILRYGCAGDERVEFGPPSLPINSVTFIRPRDLVADVGVGGRRSSLAYLGTIDCAGPIDEHCDLAAAGPYGELGPHVGSVCDEPPPRQP